MNQKRFLTLLPLAFLLMCVIILLVFAAMNKLPESKSECNEFTDEGLGIDIKYPCDFTHELETKISSNFEYNSEESLERPFLTQYKLKISNHESEIIFDAVLSESETTIKQFGEGSFEILDNDFIVEKIKDNEYRVYEKVECENTAGICGSLYISKISEKLMFRVGARHQLNHQSVIYNFLNTL